MARKATTDLEVSVSPVQCVKSFRKLVEQAGWEIERHEGARLVDRFAIIFPMAQSTRTIGIKILNGPLRGLELLVGLKLAVLMEPSILHRSYCPVAQSYQ